MHGFYDEANQAELYAKLLQFVGSSIGPRRDSDRHRRHR
jgi:hypothetical protein